jgi:outer membrane protein OmpA-like peptidoglycan-associated protein
MLNRLTPFVLMLLPSFLQAADLSTTLKKLTEHYYLGGGMGWSYLKPQPDEGTPYIVSDSNGLSFRAQTGFLLTGRISADVSLVSLGKAGIATKNAPDNTLTEISYYAATAGGVFRVWDYDHPYNLFAKVDSTLLHTSNSNDDVPVDRVHFGSFSLGMGATYRVMPQWQLRLDLENYSQDIKTVTLGLEWSPAPNPQPVALPPALPPTDSDSDGIADTIDQCPYTAPFTKVDSQGCEEDRDRDGVVNSADKCPGTPLNAKVDNDGCLLLEGPVFQLETKRIQFASNSTELTEDSKVELNRIAEYLKTEAGLLVMIEAHTDNIGSSSSNDVLSLKRADVVRAYLINQGILDNRMDTRGFGESRPIADNDTEEGRAMNRRVEFRLTSVEN